MKNRYPIFNIILVTFFICVSTICCSPDEMNSGIPKIGNIPDSAFEQALIDLGYDDVLDGKIVTANVANVLELNIPDYDFNNSDNDIKDLTGIEYFISLTKLNCSGQNLTLLNLNNNLNLRELDCGYSKYQSLSSLNISKNTALEILKCHENNLTSFKISKHQVQR